MGRPPTPLEQKRLRGRTANTDSGGRPLPKAGELVQLPMAEGVPLLPSGIESDGAELWKRIWQDGLTWISPQSDMAAAIEACLVADDLAIARRRARAGAGRGGGGGVGWGGRRVGGAGCLLGFNPTARSRLG